MARLHLTALFALALVLVSISAPLNENGGCFVEARSKWKKFTKNVVHAVKKGTKEATKVVEKAFIKPTKDVLEKVGVVKRKGRQVVTVHVEHENVQVNGIRFTESGKPEFVNEDSTECSEWETVEEVVYYAYTTPSGTVTKYFKSQQKFCKDTGFFPVDEDVDADL